MKNKSSRYAARLARRKSFGKIRIDLPAGQDLITAKNERFPMPTLNPKNFTLRLGKIVTRTFERLARADELGGAA
jgi:hypothetical protein